MRFWERKPPEPKYPVLISADRDSVCMGDDCESHDCSSSWERTAEVSRLLEWLVSYVPRMRDSVWAVCSDRGVLGYLVTDADGNTATELKGPDRLLTETGVQAVQCRYYHTRSFSRTDGETGKQIEKHAGCKTLMEKVKKELEG